MATTQKLHTGNGSSTLFDFTFEYLNESDIKVSLDGTDLETTQYSVENATNIRFVTAPGIGVAIRIYRVTNTDSAQATFFAGSAIRAQDLNDNNLQLLYATQETVNRRVDSTGGTMSGDLNMGGNKITNVADPTGGTDVVTKDYLDTFSFDPANTGSVDFTGDITVAGTATFSDDVIINDNVTINSTGFLKIPVGTDAQQPGQDDQPAAATGQIRFNTDITQFEGYNGSEWSSIGGGATGGGGDTVFVETSQLITTNYTLTTGNTIEEKKNAMSVGPVTIGPSATVTVPSGQSWVIV